MAKFPYTPSVVMRGGGSELLNKLQANRLGWAYPAMSFWWGWKLKVTGSGYWDHAQITALASSSSQVVTLGTTFPGTAMPTNVIIEEVAINLITAFAGVTSPVLSVGDTGNDDEWVDVFALDGTAGWYNDVADADAVSAEEGAPILETGYAPLATVATSSEDVDTLTAGEVDIMLKLHPLPAALPYGQP